MAGVPAQLVDLARRAGRVLEVGAARDWSTAMALREAGADVTLSDVDARVLAAPPPAMLLDVTRADAAALPPFRLVYAVRVPEELQVPIARLARAHGADLALRALKDEWADVAPEFPRHVAWPGGWRHYPRASTDRPGS